MSRSTFVCAGAMKRMFAGGLMASALLAAAAVAPSAEAGTVTIHSQSRTVSFGALGASQSFTAADNENVNKTFSETYDGNGLSGTTSASLVSTVGQDGFTFKGSVAYDVRNDRFGENGEELFAGGPDIRIVGVFEFSVDAPFTYQLGGGLKILKDDPHALVEAPSEFYPYDGAGTGLLEPGVTYRFVTPFAVDSFSIHSGTERSFSAEFDYQLLLSPVDGGNGGGSPNPIPLPPAVWSGLAVLGAGALNRLRRRGVSA